jgi:hypothetical protein
MSKEHAVPKCKILARKYGAVRAYAAVIAACLGNARTAHELDGNFAPERLRITGLGLE